MTVLAVRDANGVIQMLEVQLNGDNSLTPFHIEDAAQRVALLATLNAAKLASGLTPVTGSFAGPGASAAFTPTAGRGFNIAAWLTASAWNATIQLERSFDAGVTWLPITASGTPLWVLTAPFNEPGIIETEVGVRYRLNCTAWVSGTIAYRISQ